MIPPLAHPADPPAAQQLSAELQAALLQHGQVRVLPKGRIVVTEGEPSLAMYLVLEGQLRVYLADERGREVALSTLAPGEFFGESMLAGQTRSASVQALTRCRLCMITRSEFQQLLAARPDLAFHIIQTLVRRVRALSRRVQGLVALDVYERVVGLLNERAQPVGGQRVVPGPLSQQMVADLVGASRSMINRIFKELAEGGFISLGKDAITLHQPLPRHG